MDHPESLGQDDPTTHKPKPFSDSPDQSLDNNDCRCENMRRRSVDQTAGDPFMSYRVCKQLSISGSWLAIGLYLSILGPTLPDLRRRVDLSNEEISLLLTGRTSGFLVGALLGGVLFYLFQCHETLLMCLGTLSLSAVGLVPWVNSPQAVIALFFMAGSAEGFINVGAPPMIMELWRDKVTCPLMLNYFFSGMGTVLSPLIAQPFLSHSNTTDTNATAALCSSSPLDGSGEEEDMTHAHYSRIEIPYSIVGIAIATASLGHVFYIYKGTPCTWPQRPPCAPLRKMLHPGSCSGGYPIYSLFVLILTSLYFACFLGAQVTFGSFLSLVSVCGHLKLSTRRAALATSVYFGMLTVGRLIGAVCARFFSVNKILLTAILVIDLAMLVMCVWGQRIEVVYWITVPIIGLCCSLFFPSGLAWINSALQMNSMATMFLIIGCGLGQLSCVYIAGWVLDNYGPTAIFWISFTAFSMLPLVFLSMNLVAKTHKIQRQMSMDTVYVESDS